jgi:2-keto-4-pentenoate hydratase/2-oxohepta-3-ene-1,7-dioic acid hydratase in catechol pathway
MKLVSYQVGAQSSFGAVSGDAIIDFGKLFDGRFPDLKAFLAAGAVTDAVALIASRRADFRLDEVHLLPVIPNPGKIWCCGLNYHEHADECGATPPGKPVFFLRTADSQVAHGQSIARPRESMQLDFEAEMAAVIGKGGRRIAAEDAHAHVAGYACYNDASVRDWQLQTSQWDAGKNFWHTGAFGPWLVTADEIPFGTPMALVAKLNGQEVQRSSTDMMIHGIAAQIAYLSTIAPLAPGDVIVTGTPGGIGAMRKPPLWMKAGDVIEVSVDRIGTLSNTVADD